MRHYKLEIAKGTDVAMEFSSSSTNRTPVNIQFEVSSFRENSTNIPGFVRVYNLNPQSFLKQNQFIGKQLTLYAGWENSPFLQKLGYKQIYDNLLINTKIAGVSGEYVGLNPYMDFYYQAWTDSEKSEHQVQTSSLIKVQIEPEKPIVDTILKVLKLFTTLQVVAHSSTKAILNTQPQSILINFRTITEMFKWLMTTFSIYPIVNMKTQTITLKAKPASNEQDASELAEAATAKVVNPVEFLTQPQLTGVGGHFSATLRLRPDLKIDEYIRLGSGVIANFEALNQNFIEKNSMVKIQDALKKLFQGGLVKIVKVQHLGDFANNAVEAWSTAIEFIVEGVGK